MLMVAIRQRPASCDRISRSTRLVEVSSNRREAVPPAPRVLVEQDAADGQALVDLGLQVGEPALLLRW